MMDRRSGDHCCNHPTMLFLCAHLPLSGGILTMRKLLGLFALAAGVVLFGGPAFAQGPIRIGASLSLTGTYAEPGTFQSEGYKLCERDLNAKGGLLGRKVEFVVYDD